MNAWSINGSPSFLLSTQQLPVERCLLTWLFYWAACSNCHTKPPPPTVIWVPFHITHNNNIFEGVFMGVCRSCCCCCFMLRLVLASWRLANTVGQICFGFSMSMFALLWEFAFMAPEFGPFGCGCPRHCIAHSHYLGQVSQWKTLSIGVC